MDQMQLLLWNQMMTSQPEHSRTAHAEHLRAEQRREARTPRPSVASILARTWEALTGRTRAAVEPGVPATQS